MKTHTQRKRENEVYWRVIIKLKEWTPSPQKYRIIKLCYREFWKNLSTNIEWNYFQIMIMSSQWLFHHFVLYIIFIHSLLNFLLRAGTVIVRNGQECAYILFVKSVSWWSIKCVLHVIMQYGQQTRDRKVNGSDFECHVSVSVHSCRQCVSRWDCKHCKVWEVCVTGQVSANQQLQQQRHRQNPDGGRLARGPKGVPALRGDDTTIPLFHVPTR